MAFFRYSSASFIFSILACPWSDRTKLLVLRAPVILVVVVVDGVVVDSEGAGLLVEAAGFFLAAGLLPPGLGPNKALRFASALRL